MLKYIFCWLLAFFSLEAKEYIVRYQPLSSGSLYSIETKAREKIGTVVREQKNDSVVYSFFNLNNQLLASGSCRHYFAKTDVQLINNSGSIEGWFSADIDNLYPREYRVFSKENKMLATGSMNWLGTICELVDPSCPKHCLITFFRPMFKLFYDNWHFDIHEEGYVDFYLLSILGAFQTACDLNFEMLDKKAVNYSSI